MKDDTETTKAEANASNTDPAEVEDAPTATEDGDGDKTSEEANVENQQDTTSPASDVDGNDDGGGEVPPADDPPSNGNGKEGKGGDEKYVSDEGEGPSDDKPVKDAEDTPAEESKQDDADLDKSKDAGDKQGKGETKEATPKKAGDEMEPEQNSPDPPEDGDDDDDEADKVVVSKSTEKKSWDNETPEEEVAAPVSSKQEDQKESTLKPAADGRDDESNNPFAIEDDVEGEVEPTPGWSDDSAPAVASGDIEEGDDDKKEKKSKKSGFFFSKKKKKKESSDWAKESGVVDEERVAVPTPPPAVCHDDDGAPTAAVKFDGMGGVSIGGVHISEMRLPLVGMFLSAAVLLVAVLVYKGPGLQKESYRNYAISVPSATMCMSFLMVLMTSKNEFYAAYGKIPNQITFLWNFVGACILTFSGPFKTTGNG
jgi:hypothetical protein